MFKKVLIATLAVVFGLAVIKGTWIGSHLRLNCSKVRAWVKDRVPPEKEIERLKMEIRNLEQNDEEYFDKVAKQRVDVRKLERAVENLKKDLSRRETGIREMRETLTGTGEYVTFNGNRYERASLVEQIRLDARAFQADEATLKSKEEKLKAMKRNLSITEKKFNDLKVVRQQMSTELQLLENALVEERQAQAQAESTIDDAGYQRIRKDMDSIRDKIELLKAKREVKGEASNGPVRATEKQRTEDAKIDKFLETRFGAKKEVVSEK
jgi:chromosome segregation ATPase